MLGTVDLTQIAAHDGSETKRRKHFVYSPPTAAAGGYLTGGDPMVASDLNLGVLDTLHIDDAVTVAGVMYSAAYDYVNGKLMLFVGTTGLEVANATDLSALKIHLEAIGR